MPSVEARSLFQSTRPYGARRRRMPMRRVAVAVSIHAPVRGATRSRSSAVQSSIVFQSTRPYGARRRHPSVADGRRLRFQSTRPYGARPWTRPVAMAIVSCFNPRARTGRDVASTSMLRRVLIVSIHAPVRGATSRRHDAAGRDEFQSTRPYGARRARSCACSRADQLFQSTRPYGARHVRQSDLGRCASVSIHAPVRGATSSRRDLAVVCDSFNPRARTGRDAAALLLAALASRVSIHAPVRGATRSARCGQCIASDVSIHAPVRGATRVASAVATGQRVVSIHAPVRGATRASLRRSCGQRCFNPRARTGRDIGRSRPWHRDPQFQSTRPYGARRA